MTMATSLSRAVSLTSLALLLASPASAQEQPVQSFPLNVYKSVLDGQWQGIRYASDGNVYFGSSTHSAHHGAAFFKFDPRTNQITMLAEDLTTICGEDPATNPQGKLHSDIVEANGWLYMSMHFSSELPGAYDHWTGSHVIGYQLATGAFHDFGVVHPNYTSYSAIGVDPARNYLYVFVTGEDAGDVSYLYRIDTVTGMKTNLGQVGGAWNASFWTFVDRRGDVWFSVVGQNGALRRVRGATGQIDVFPNALPPMYRWDSEQLVSASEQAGRWIMWMQPLDGDRALFTLGWNGGMLYMFDASKPIGSGLEFQVIKHIGYSDLGLAIGGSRLFYYQRANRGFGQQEATDFHLLSVSLDSAGGYPISDHGLLRDQNGRLAWRLPGMMTDGTNRVFMIGDWWTVPGDLGTLRYNYNNGVETYQQLPRGEFFAFADVDIDPAPGDPPVAPDSFTAIGISSTHINLSWSDVTGATGLSLERCSGAGCTSFAQIASLGADQRSFANSGLSAGVLYRYRLRAFNQGASVYSNIAEAATTAPLPPAPQSLIATTSSTTEIALRWTETSAVETGFVIERCAATGCASFVTVGQVAANTTTFVNGGLNSSTLYRFRVRASNAGGSSASSNVAEATTLPTVPTALTAVTASSTQINITWSAAPGAAGTKVERCSGTACTNFILVAQLTATTSASTGLRSRHALSISSPGVQRRGPLRVFGHRRCDDHPAGTGCPDGHIGVCKRAVAALERHYRGDRIPPRTVHRRRLYELCGSRTNCRQRRHDVERRVGQRDTAPVPCESRQRRRRFARIQYRREYNPAGNSFGPGGNTGLERTNQSDMARSRRRHRRAHRAMRGNRLHIVCADRADRHSYHLCQHRALVRNCLPLSCARL